MISDAEDSKKTGGIYSYLRLPKSVERYGLNHQRAFKGETTTLIILEGHPVPNGNNPIPFKLLVVRSNTGSALFGNN